MIGGEEGGVIGTSIICGRVEEFALAEGRADGIHVVVVHDRGVAGDYVAVGEVGDVVEDDVRARSAPEFLLNVQGRLQRHAAVWVEAAWRGAIDVMTRIEMRVRQSRYRCFLFEHKAAYDIGVENVARDQHADGRA